MFAAKRSMSSDSVKRRNEPWVSKRAERGRESGRHIHEAQGPIPRCPWLPLIAAGVLWLYRTCVAQVDKVLRHI
jgi:hypothetical protein